MATIVDRLNISISLGANTGKVTGDLRLGRPKHLLLTNGAELTNDDLADSDSLQAWLEEKMSLSRTDPEKVFLFSGFHEMENNTGDPNTATLQDGYEEVLNEAIPKYIGRHTADVGQTQSFVAFNGFTGTMYIIDTNGRFAYIGKQGGGGKGFDVAYLYSSYPQWGGSGAINTGTVRFTLADVEQLKNNVGAVQVSFNPADLVNMVDVKLSELATASGYAFKIGARTNYTGTNIYPTYQDSLAVVGAWKATLVSDGSNVTIASAAKDATLKGWTVTLGSSPTIAANAKVKIELVDPATLAGLTIPVEGIESISVKVTKP
jgi:aryl carrier-like protein